MRFKFSFRIEVMGGESNIKMLLLGAPFVIIIINVNEALVKM